jgi:hypothetical protein
MELAKRPSRVHNKEDLYEERGSTIYSQEKPPIFSASKQKQSGMRQSAAVTDEDEDNQQSQQRVQTVISRRSITEVPTSKVVPGVIKSNKVEVEMIALKDEKLIYDLVGFDNASSVSAGPEISIVEDSRSEDPNTLDSVLHRVIAQTLIAYSCDQRLSTI